ncbi:MAG: ATP-binding protein [Puia sp.]|nr:ATP-binding protein [Puia sp.]
MKKFSLSNWFRNVSIAQKLYFTVGIMALLIAVELLVLIFSINTLSSVRAYVNGESLWSKAQKDAIFQLLTYAHSHDEADYRKFRNYMKVPVGDHKTLAELAKERPDMEAAAEGFIEGRNHPDDVDGMISLFRRFHANSYISKAISAWIQADRLVTGFIPIGEELHAEINSPAPSQERIDSSLRKIPSLNARLTPYEDAFSFALGEGSRWLEHVILRLLFVVALSVECTGLILAITVSRGIQRGLKEILLSAQAVARRDFSRKARAFSKDEIGILAHNFNQMSSQLEQLQEVITKANIHLEKTVTQRTAELESKNKELEQFAYVASHDLQEPLRTISSFVELLKKQYRGRLDENADKYIDYTIQASDRMKTLIKDLLDYSRIGREKESRPVDTDALLKEVIADLDKSIRENEASVEGFDLPVINAYRTELKLLFQNLVANSIKFRRPGIPPQVTIRAEQKNGLLEFSFRDNGIGIEEKFQDRIFIIFQRLHTRSEYEGSGIGLAHCKKIVEIHGGRLWVESTPGQGSTFYFTLPRN